MKLAPGDKVLVTGGTGVIGGWVVRDLLESGFKPVVMTRGITHIGNDIFAGRREEIEFVKCDLEQPWAILDTLLRVKPQGIVHFASVKPWQIDPPSVPNADPVSGINNMIVGTMNMLEAARQLGIKRFVYGSSKAVYSPNIGDYAYPTYKPIPESYETNPTNMYGIGKRSAEMIGLYYHKVFGLDFVAVRFAGTYGPLKRGSGTRPASLIARCARGEAVEVEVDEYKFKNERNEYVYNRDIGRSITRCCAAETLTSRIYNIGTGVALTLEELFAAMRQAVPGAPINVTVTKAVIPVPGQRREGPLDVSAARKDLNFDAHYDIVSGIRDTANFYGTVSAPEMARV